MNNEDVLVKQFFRYIHKLAYHARVDYLRNQCRRNRNEFLFGEFSNEIMEETSSEELYPSECTDTLKWIAGKLKPEEYDIVRLNIIEGHSISDISALLGKSDRWARTVRTQALRELKVELEREKIV